MECAIVNLIEPGDRILIFCIGLWGERAADIAERLLLLDGDVTWNYLLNTLFSILKFAYLEMVPK